VQGSWTEHQTWALRAKASPPERDVSAFCEAFPDARDTSVARVGADIPTGVITPIRASLAWTLDQGKMRHHLMFGWRRFFFQLAKGPRLRRVGLLIDGPAHAGCMLMSNPGRQPIGYITSTAWSPALSSRVGMAYVQTEYARNHKHVLVTVPYNLPTNKMRREAIIKWIRQGPRRAAYRRITPACVMSLPFVPHSYPEHRGTPRRRPKHPAPVVKPLHAAPRSGARSTNPAPAISEPTSDLDTF